MLHFYTEAERTVLRFQFESTFKIISFPGKGRRIENLSSFLVVFAVGVDTHAVLQFEAAHLQVVHQAAYRVQTKGLR